MQKGFSVCMMSALYVGFIASSAAAQSQTAQSAMVQTNFDSNAYIIEGTITWTFDRDVAATYYTNGWDGNAPAVTCSGAGCSAAPAAPGAPAPDDNKMTPFLNSQAKCTFFLGGALPSSTYTQTVNVNLNSGPNRGNWRFTYTYRIDPTQPSVDPHTAWTSAENVSAVDVGFSGFLASESFLKQSNRNKYSFTMVDAGASRARNVSATLQKDDGFGNWGDLLFADLNNQDIDADTINDALIIVAATADFSYFGNGGVFGNAAVFGALHYDTGKPAATVNNILNGTELTGPADNFAGNNNDLGAGNVHTAPFVGSFNGLTENGNYRVRVNGALKGNSSGADFGFSVTSSIVTIGGCTAP
jgi:hypothetical protein